MATITATCECGRSHRVDTARAGQSGHCPCGAVFAVPALVPAMASVVLDEPSLRPRKPRPARRFPAVLAGVALAAIVGVGVGITLGRSPGMVPALPLGLSLSPAQRAVKAEILRTSNDPSACSFEEWEEAPFRPGRGYEDAFGHGKFDVAVRVQSRVRNVFGAIVRDQKSYLVKDGRVLSPLTDPADLPIATPRRTAAYRDLFGDDR